MIKFNIDFDLCPRWTGVIIRNVTVKQSTDLVKDRLKKVGLRPINNIVDATNYIMWETGNPLHAFDLDKIRGGQMILTASKGGEIFKSLDGIDYKLPQNTIIIKDLGRVIDLCGIKGGENSAISSQTKNILLVVPIYNGVAVRKASKALGLRSDASAIFERGADPGNTTETLQKAMDLIGGKAEDIFDLKKSDFKPWQVSVTHEKIEKVLGIEVDKNKVKKIFESLGMEVKGEYMVTVPTFRNDLHIEEDLIEEVGRIIGYNNFPKTLPNSAVPTEKVAYARDCDLEYEIKNTLKGAGYSEIYTYSLVSKKQILDLGYDPEKCFKVLNPISSDFEYLRPQLFGNLLGAFKLNSAENKDIKIFELGKRYFDIEEYWVWGAISGEKTLEAKGIVEKLLTEYKVGWTLRPATKEDNHFWMHPGRVIQIENKKGHCGVVGEVNPSLLTKWGIKERVTIWSFNYDLFEKEANVSKIYQPISKFPPIIEDLTLTIPEGTLIGELMEKIKTMSKLIVNVELISTHERNFSFRITYQDQTKNLTDEDILPIRKKLEKNS